MALTLKTAGAKLQQYASGQSDPLYAVGSYFHAGRDYPSIEVIEAAAFQLQKNRHATKLGKASYNVKALSELINFLDKHVAKKASATARPSRKSTSAERPKAFPKKVSVAEPEGLHVAVTNFVAKAQHTVDEHYRKEYPSLSGELLTIEEGQRYIRVVKSSRESKLSRSVYCFIDKTNGDVLKAASWKAPAKGARGNVFNTDNGLGGVTAYGGKYNR